ncbi:MAG: hypothetical protein NXI25_08695 [bacterium]|nr:hypothetical protein [bacterium]
MSSCMEWIIRAYVYCTDFIINVANGTGLSYFEVNALLFVLVWPVVTFGLLGYLVWLCFKYWRLKKEVSA